MFEESDLQESSAGKKTTGNFEHEVAKGVSTDANQLVGVSARERIRLRKKLKTSHRATKSNTLANTPLHDPLESIQLRSLQTVKEAADSLKDSILLSHPVLPNSQPISDSYVHVKSEDEQITPKVEPEMLTEPVVAADEWQLCPLVDVLIVDLLE